MYTLLPLKKHAQIQICPTFLTWAMPAPNRWTVLLSPSYWTKITVELAKRLKTATSYTPIDALSLFDKVMVHEVSSY